MANPLYARLQTTADRLIKKYGQVGAIKRSIPPDPVLGGDAEPQTFPAKLVPMTYDQRFVNGTSILSTDRQVYISSVGLSIIPTDGDIVSAGGVDYLIIAGDPNNYDGLTSVVFIVQGRIM
ncbi:hypothetical protein LAV84_18285 [Rhizobium sp. VS19-DR104.2]|uniref:hypothetical protein n=1 Tax=unclassified Rhizobium TaxID=2613769 RepID=UPI001CC40123|nr:MULTISPECIES: hypothetical protein [unclassified Rhizobium]MBZ5761583.1 hypothetical protein [Rhizobium sp. VS19-DR96]MBZ5767531.1 hypothetical protein [Rhizobium sp. VS19-DR129.2]MBZ5775019.1 hypothetical protein [Rhizobium sp. VS19-DRK62.2]MBZ5786014.1 hypothetical protein [Rhizobium sp. VS19-DR121]MBZ5803442.1 hypothetical protein [Rhizobium sp. VS19-DR181]